MPAKLLFISSLFFLLSCNQKKLPKYGEPDHKIGSFSLLNQDGKTITNKDVANKIRVVEFFFTTCKSICPKMNSNMQKVYKAFLNNPDVLIMSHTVDPKTDSVGELKRYSDSLGINSSKWLFLTGDKKQIYDVARYQYLVSAGDSLAPIEEDFIHTNKFVLIDKDNNIRVFCNGTDEKDVQRLIDDIKFLE